MEFDMDSHRGAPEIDEQGNEYYSSDEDSLEWREMLIGKYRGMAVTYGVYVQDITRRLVFRHPNGDDVVRRYPRVQPRRY